MRALANAVRTNFRWNREAAAPEQSLIWRCSNTLGLQLCRLELFVSIFGASQLRHSLRHEVLLLLGMQTRHFACHNVTQREIAAQIEILSD